MVDTEKTAEEMTVEALAILQRGLPGGDLNDREVITELWGVFDNPDATRLFQSITSKSPDPAEDRSQKP